ncbi:serine protease [Pseudomonas sp. UYIF39]|uniref:trypsin-like serine peptidase n=1 Tax=Pseudomonas sp. UYIF39 TaxID=1630747 RepID=UPI00249F178A|nr:serine protease [Pseudomonas sp. UYIF39]MDI3355644.1 serine protease [Pseudomonas sp. UYIF39]
MNYKSIVRTTIPLIALTFSLASCAYTVPEPPEPVLLSNADGQYAHWNGIGETFKDGNRYCTASLLDTRDATGTSTGPAYLLTNGHCTSITSGTAADIPYDGQVQFNFFHDTMEGAKRYDIHKVNWTSLASSDVAILELTDSLDTLLKDGMTPLKLASKAPAEPRPIQVFGAPGIAPGLRLSTCTLEPTNTALIKFFTVHTDYQKHDCKGIARGSSGSPVLDAATGEVIGVLSGTTYGISTDDLCFWHALCGNNQKKSILPDQASHSFPVDYLSYCFTNGRFNADAQSCTIKPAFNFESERNADITLYRKPVDHNDQAPVWDVDFSMSTVFYRFKTVRDAHACYLADHYSHPISTTNAKVDAEIGREEGLYYLCLVGVESAEQRPSVGLRRNTQILTARLVEPTFATLPEPTVTFRFSEKYVSVRWLEKYSRSIWTRYYDNDLGERNCSDIDRREYAKTTSGLAIPLESLPVTLCSYFEDRNFNTSEVHTVLVQAPTTVTDTAP